MDVAFLFAMVIGMLLIGVPIAVSLGLSSIFFLLIFSDSSLGRLALTCSMMSAHSEKRSAHSSSNSNLRRDAEMLR